MVSSLLKSCHFEPSSSEQNLSQHGAIFNKVPRPSNVAKRWINVDVQCSTDPTETFNRKILAWLRILQGPELNFTEIHEIPTHLVQGTKKSSQESTCNLANCGTDKYTFKFTTLRCRRVGCREGWGPCDDCDVDGHVESSLKMDDVWLNKGGIIKRWAH